MLITVETMTLNVWVVTKLESLRVTVTVVEPVGSVGLGVIVSYLLAELYVEKLG